MTVDRPCPLLHFLKRKQKTKSFFFLTLSPPDLISNSPCCLLYHSHDVCSEKLVLDQLIIPLLNFFFALFTFLLDIDIVRINFFVMKEKMSVRLLWQEHGRLVKALLPYSEFLCCIIPFLCVTRYKKSFSLHKHLLS